MLAEKFRHELLQHIVALESTSIALEFGPVSSLRIEQSSAQLIDAAVSSIDAALTLLREASRQSEGHQYAP